MPWVKIDENFPRHPKVVAAGPLGMAMQVAALCYCNQYLTDGFIPTSVANTMLDLDGIAMNVWSGEMVGGGDDATCQLVIDRLLAVGLWKEVKGGYRIHDYLEFQPSKAQVLAARKQRSEAGRIGGTARARKRQPSEPLNEPLSNRLAEAQAHA